MFRSDTQQVATPYISPYVRVSDGMMTNLISAATYKQTDARAILIDKIRNASRQASEEVIALSPLMRKNSWLFDEAWLFASEADVWSASRLRFASIETIAACNQSCYFCPVSIAPRPVTRMSYTLFERIVAQLGTIDSMEGIFLNNYNEPFLDKRLPEMTAEIAAAGLKIGVNTNAAVPFDSSNWRKCAARITLLTVNLHTLDPERYARERGKDDLQTVVQNINLYRQCEIAETVRIAVLGHGGEQHQRDFDRIATMFLDKGIEVETHILMDRCGAIENIGPAFDHGPLLGGCEQTGSRVLEHIHVLTDGRCVLCCEDYAEKYVVGDLRTQSVREVMSGEALGMHRRKVYGAERCDEGYICRHCKYATAAPKLDDWLDYPTGALGFKV